MMLNLSRDPIFIVLERKKVYKEMRGNKKIRPYCSAALACEVTSRVRQEEASKRKRPDSIGEVLAQDVHSTDW